MTEILIVFSPSPVVIKAKQTKEKLLSTTKKRNYHTGTPISICIVYGFIVLVNVVFIKKCQLNVSCM